MAGITWRPDDHQPQRGARRGLGTGISGFGSCLKVARRTHGPNSPTATSEKKRPWRYSIQSRRRISCTRRFRFSVSPVSRRASHLGLLSCLTSSGLSSACLSMDGELAADRSLVPTPHVGLVASPSGSCTATLIRSDKVLSLARCVAGVPASDVTFVTQDGAASPVRAVSVSGPSSQSSSFSTAAEAVRLTLASPVAGPFVSARGTSTAVSGTWLETFDLHGRRMLLPCTDEKGVDPPNCGDRPRLPGGLIYTTQSPELIGLAVDLGPNAPALDYQDVARAPDSLVDLTVHVGGERNSPQLQLAAADPEWNRIGLFSNEWGEGWSVAFTPVSVALFDDDGTTEYVATSNDGRLWTSHRYGAELETPIAARSVEVLDDGDTTVLWVSDEAGALCRRPWLPRPLAWQCVTTLGAFEDFAVLRLGAQELVVVAGERVSMMNYQDGTFEAPQAWGLEGSSARAVTLGQLSDRTPYVVVAHGTDALSIRVRGPDAVWIAWEPFGAGRLPAVEALAGGQVPGWPARIFAAAGRHLYYTIETNGEFGGWR